MKMIVLTLLMLLPCSRPAESKPGCSNGTAGKPAGEDVTIDVL